MHYRSLKWWNCGWYSLYQWEHVLWQVDDNGTAVIVNRDMLRLFHNIENEIGVL